MIGAAPADPLSALHAAVPVAATGLAGGPLLQWSPSFNDLRHATAPAPGPADVALAASATGRAGVALTHAPNTAQPGPLQASTPVPEAALLSGLLLFVFALLLRRFARPQRRPLLIGARLPTLGSVARPPATAAAAAAAAPRHQQHSDAPRGLQAT